MLIARQLSIGYQSRVLLAGIDIALQPGMLACLLGPNGAGKSTLLKTLAGMHPAHSGDVLLDSLPLARYSRQQIAQRIALVLAERSTPPAMTAYELVSLGRMPHTDWLHRLGPVDETAVSDALEATDTTAFAERLVSELSDGERQRVWIARALAQQPGVLMLDEPTAFLDITHRHAIMHRLRDLAHSRQIAVVISTHDLDLALQVADALWLMDGQRHLLTGKPTQMIEDGLLTQIFGAAAALVSAQPR